MASSDLLYPIFVLTWNLSSLHTNSFPIGGKLGQASCKLFPFLRNVSIVLSMQNLILIAVDRFGAVVFPLRCPLIRSKLCSFFILFYMDSCRSGQFAILVHFRARWTPRGSPVCYWMGESIRRVLILCQFRTSFLQSVCIHTCAVASHSLLHHCYQAQDTGTPRWTVRQQSATAGQKKQKRASNVHCYRNSVCALLVTLLYQLFNRMVSGQFHAFLV